MNASCVHGFQYFEEGGDGQAQQAKAFLALASTCIQEKSETILNIIDVAKELMRIDKSM